MKKFRRGKARDKNPDSAGTVTIDAPQATRSVLASAALVEHTDIRTAVKTGEWQRKAWDFYDSVSELRYGVGWIAHALSQCGLFVGEVDDSAEQPEPTENAQARKPLEELLDAQANTGDLLYRTGIQLGVVGESFLVGFDEGERRRWLVCSSDEITVGTGGRVQVRLPETGQRTTLDKGSYLIIRTWRSHPREACKPDSPVLALTPVLSELRALTDHVKATINSRLASAGLFVVPSSAEAPGGGASESDNVNSSRGTETRAWMESLKVAMGRALRDRDEASSVVPLVARAPSDAADKFQYFTFSTEFDQRVQEMRQDAIRRIATGLDLPPEMLLGLGETSNHWTSWRISEMAITLGVEPVLRLIADSLTTHLLRPALQRQGVDNPEKYVVAYDTSQLVLRANRAPEAAALYEQGLLSKRVVLKEHGYTEDDLPSDEEGNDILARQLVTSNPNLTAMLYPELVRGDPQAPETNPTQPQERPPDDPSAGREERPREPRQMPQRETPPAQTAAANGQGAAR